MTNPGRMTNKSTLDEIMHILEFNAKRHRDGTPAALAVLAVQIDQLWREIR